MPAVLVTGPTVMQDSPFLPNGWMDQAELTWVPGSVPGWFVSPQTVTDPGNYRARCRVTTLIESNALPSLHTGTFRLRPRLPQCETD